MGIIDKLIGGGAKALTDSIGGLVDRFVTTSDEKQEFKLEAARLIGEETRQLEESLRTELQTKERVLVAELNQGDSYTKRARPSIIYVGLGLAVVQLVVGYIAFFIGRAIPEPAGMVPMEFWIAWGGVAGTWVIGRSAERRGYQNQLTAIITGNGKKPSGSILDR